MLMKLSLSAITVLFLPESIAKVRSDQPARTSEGATWHGVSTVAWWVKHAPPPPPPHPTRHPRVRTLHCSCACRWSWG
jgi:hypothetical protein